MKRYGYGLAAGLLWLSVFAYAQEQPVADYVQAVTAYLQQETGKTPQSQEIVDVLNRLVVKVYQDGDYRAGLTIAEQTYRFADRALGPEHPDTLSSVNNLAFLYQAQGRYGEAEPLYQRALTSEIGRFIPLGETGNEATEVANAYWDYWNIKPQVWLASDAAEARLKTLAAPPKVLHLATHGFYLSTTSGLVDRPMVLSGVALAGANQGLQGHFGPTGEDGILYAL